MFFKRKRKLKPPLARTPDETPFQVYEILEPEEKRTYRGNRFVSPIFGKHAKDEVVIPIMTDQKRDLDKLDSFRAKPKLTKEQLIEKYGTAYPEFDLVRGKNLQEALDSQGKPKERPVKATVIEGTPESGTEPTTQPQPDTNGNNAFTTPQAPKTPSEPAPTEPQKEEPNGDIVEPGTTEEPTPEDDASSMTPKEGFVRSDAKALENYRIPPMSLISKPQESPPDLTKSIQKHIDILDKTFAEFNVGASVIKHTQGPTVTRYEVVLDKGVNVKKVTALQDNLKMALAAKEIRIEAPIPGKSTVGIEVPNEIKQTVHFADIIDHSRFIKAAQPLTIALGLDIDGSPVYASIRSMPHGLVAGQTGSGKSVCINTVLMSLLLKYTPSELKLILIDPKMVELSSYNDIPHLITPVITDSKAATAALRWVVEEMDRRFNTFAETRVRDIDAYNQSTDNPEDKMPYIVIVVDELSDLMMVSSQHVEDAIKRLTQKARACGIHLIIATQRPSTDVIKGTIKSNIPTRIAFSVASHVDSQTIIDASGADKLLGRGDMLFATNGQGKIRVQGAYISDDDIDKVTTYIRQQMKPNYLFDQETLAKNVAKALERDEYFDDVARYVVTEQEASINKISKRFGIGFNRAQSIVEGLEELGVVSENLGSRAREVLVAEDALDELLTKHR